MTIVIADTSGLVAAVDDGHPDRAASAAALREAGSVVISPVVLAELDHVARRVLGRGAAAPIIDDIRRWARAGRALLPTITADILDTAQSVRRRYHDLDLADAVNVALAGLYHTNEVLTLDRRDFRTVRPLTVGHVAFRLLPDDR